jgi:polyisoprenoid-binding protein YceI
MSAETQQTTTTPIQTKTTWVIDPVHSNVEFGVKHMMFTTVKGHFAGITGTITVDEANPANSSANVEIEVASVDTRDEKRDAHLRSADFFDAEKFPHITFTTTRVEPKGGNDVRVHGNLTIHGVTREIALDASRIGQGKNPWGMEVAGFEASTKLNRKDFEMKFNVPLDGGGLMVGDEVKITIDIEATKQQ